MKYIVYVPHTITDERLELVKRKYGCLCDGLLELEIIKLSPEDAQRPRDPHVVIYDEFQDFQKESGK